MLLNDFRHALEGPVNLLTADNERRRDSNYPVVRLLAQDSFSLERFAVGTRRAVQFDADPQAFAAHLFQLRAAQGLQQGQEIRAKLGGTLHHLLFDEDAQRGRAMAQPSGLPPKVLPWSPGLNTRVPEDLPRILVDSNQLSQVLMNLLINAAEATPGGGRITISARPLASANSIEICVSDTGCGIPPDILPHVFEPFFTTKGGKGTGLGLSISETYVRRNKGDIRIDSVLKQGTTVTITLPIGQEESPKAPEQSEIVV
jgi:hypothetical protein